jgi:hypothetical protein
MSEPAPTELLALQRAFLQTLGGEADLLQSCVQSGGLSAERRVQIYRNAYASRLVEALQALLPQTAAWLGAEAFDAGASAYVAEHPPTHWRLDAYGRDFGDWLVGQDPDWRPAADLARLEAALRRAFDGPDSAVVTAAALTALAPADWMQLVVRFVPVCEWLTVSAGTLTAWHALRAGARPDVPQADAPAITVMVWRRAGQTCFRSLEPALAALAALLKAGEPFAAACLGTGLDPARAAAALQEWIGEALIASIAVGTDLSSPPHVSH